MAEMNVRKGDNVMVIAGKDKGKAGKVLAVRPATGRIYVEGVNIVSKSKKPRNAQDKGGKEADAGRKRDQSCPDCPLVDFFRRILIHVHKGCLKEGTCHSARDKKKENAAAPGCKACDCGAPGKGSELEGVGDKLRHGCWQGT